MTLYERRRIKLAEIKLITVQVYYYKDIILRENDQFISLLYPHVFIRLLMFQSPNAIQSIIL